MFDAPDIKKQFPIFEKYPGLVFLDNASTTQKPRVVLDAMEEFYVNDNANIHRGVYGLAERADAAFEGARVACALFVGAAPEEIVFVKNATEAANLVAYSYGESLSDSGEPAVTAGDNIVVTELEHHANYLPWQELASRNGATLRVMPIDVNTGELLEDGLKLIDEKTRIVAVTMMSNVLGVMPDIAAIVKAAKAVGAKVVLDAAQGAAHLELDVKKLSVDFALVTGHKIFGPMGIGFLYGKKELLEKMPPLLTGGGMVKELPNIWLDSPSRFEAGTPNVAGAVGLAAAISFIEKLPEGWREHEKKLAGLAREKLAELEKVKVFPGENSIVAFAIEGIHPHDIASILAEKEVCIRAGHHCAKPLMKSLGMSATARASFSIYNTEGDVQKFINAVKQVLIVFR
jgi:cysteine desulfurase/selenocysteine lyase